jgi:SET domain-containing protein
MSVSETWTDPHQCPFCDEALATPGEGFMIHLDENADCESEFEDWRRRVSDDMRGGWAG